MNLRSVSIALAGSVILAACADQAPTLVAPSTTLAAKAAGPSNYIVEFTGDVAPADFAARVAALGGTVETSLKGSGLAIVSGSSTDLEAQVEQIPGVFAATPDISVQWINPNERIVEMAVDTTNDTYFPSQWHLDAIDAPEAWSTGATGAGVRVAVLDGGIYAAHPDLAANVDVSKSRSYVPGFAFNQDVGTLWHGTHVAGIIAAADNNTGVIGVAPKATIISVKVLHNGTGNFSWLIPAIEYASTPIAQGGAGADIINMSLGAVIDGKPDAQGDRKDTKAFLRILDKVVAFANRNGTTVIASAGNDGIDFDSPEAKDAVSIPADSRGVIAVSATGPLGWALGNRDFARQASYTNYGKALIDLSAPGGDFALPGNDLCLFPATANRVGQQFCWALDMVLSTSRGTTSAGGYSWAAGTSMASPVTAGVAALIIGQHGSPMQPAQVEAALEQSAIDLGKPGFDAVYGHGWVNAARAVGTNVANGN